MNEMLCKVLFACDICFVLLAYAVVGCPNLQMYIV